MEQDYNILNKPGFTINMSHYVKKASEIRDGFIINGEAWLKIRVNSTYELGYVFGAFLSRGISNLSNHRGQVVFRFKETEDMTKLYTSVEEAFNIAPRFRKLRDDSYEMIVYSKPIARLLSEFGKNPDKHIPQKYLVDNQKYLLGIKDGIEDFDGLKKDDRDILNPYKYSHDIEKVYNLIN